jgi:hypothetical protein
MDWIERLFGVSLDGGNGTAEALIVTIVCASLFLAYLSVARRRRPGA